MKKTLFGIVGLCAIIASILFTVPFPQAKATTSPFNPETDQRFKKLEKLGTNSYAPNYNLINIALPTDYTFVGSSGNLTAEVGPSTNGTNFLRVLKAAYVVNGSTGNGAVSTAGVDLGVHLPAKSIVVRSFIYTDVTPTYVSGATLAWGIATTNAGLKAATTVSTYSTAGTFTEGIQTGAASAFTSYATQADVFATVASQAISTGTFDIYVEYVNYD